MKIYKLDSWTARDWEIINGLKRVFGARFLEVTSPTDLNNKFFRQSLRGKDVILFSELNYISGEIGSVIKGILGRDEISTGVKFSQISEGKSFVSKATIIGVTNERPNVVFGSDRGLYSRFIMLECPVIPQQTYPGMYRILTDDIVGLINWALTLNKVVLDQQIRVETKLADKAWEEHDLVDFLLETVTEKNEGFLPVQELKDKISSYHTQTGNKKSLNKSVIEDVILILKAVFGVQARKHRPRMSSGNRSTVLTGVAWKGDMDPSLQLLQVDPKENPLYNLDPWKSPVYGPGQRYQDFFVNYQEFGVEAITAAAPVEEYYQESLQYRNQEEALFLENLEENKTFSSIEEEILRKVTEFESHLPTPDKDPVQIIRNLLDGMEYLGSLMPPLEEANVYPYDPTHKYPNWQVFAERALIVSLHAIFNRQWLYLAKKLRNPNGVSEDPVFESIWNQTKHICQSRNLKPKYFVDVKTGKEKSFKWPGSFFPLKYDTPFNTLRLTHLPGSTVTTICRPWKELILIEFIKFLEIIYQDLEHKYHITEIDLNQCHLRIAVALGNPSKMQEILHSLDLETFWDDQIQWILKRYPDINPEAGKQIKKMLKVDLLLSVNGGFAGSSRNLQEALKKGYQEAMGIPEKRLKEILLDLAAHWGPLQELTAATRPFMRPAVYTSLRAESYRAESDHRQLSPIWCGFERIFTSIIMEELFKANTDTFVVPLALEHDGVLVLSSKPISQDLLNTIASNLDLLCKRLGWAVSMPVEAKIVYSSQGIVRS